MNGKTCYQCRHIHLSEGAQPQCKRYPPQGVFIPGAGAQGPTTISFFPPVNPENPCGEWTVKLEAVKIEAEAMPVVRPVIPAEPFADWPKDDGA